MRAATIPIGAILSLVAATTAIADDARPHPGGFWKCRVGPTLHAEFNGEDPVGLSARSHIPTDCALHWSDGHGKTYCFASNPSFLAFQDDPPILDRARAFWNATRRDR